MKSVREWRWWLSCGLVCLAAATSACGSKQSTAPTAPTSSAAPAPTAPLTTGTTISGTVVGVSTGSTIRTHAMNLTVAVTGTTITSAVDDGGRFMLQNVPTGHVDLRFSGPNVDAHLGLDGIADHSSIAITVRLNGTTAQLDDDNRENPNNEVEVEGLVTSKSASTLTVNGRMIQITATTQIVHGDTTIPLSSIAVGDRVHVKGTASGSTASGTSIVTATKIEVQQQSTPPANGKDDGSNDDGNDNGDNQSGGNNTSAEVSGAVAGLSGTCPTLTFTVGSTTVKTSASTQFKGTTCGSLKSGVKVEVTGTRQSDKSILATSVQKD